MAHLYLIAIPLFLTLAGIADGSGSFTFVNKCQYKIWPGLLSGAGSPPLPTTGFALDVSESRTIQAPSSWGGRFWARTHCTESAGNFSCLTGDCGTGKLECAGNIAVPPASLAEFKLDGDGGKDFYDVSLVDGYNLPLLVVPQGGAGENCSATGCVADLNGACPPELRVASADGGGSVACKSACEAFRQDQYCCSGAHSNPDTCKPSPYSLAFKSACPRAYSYAYDDKTSTFTCAGGADYIITFCPSPNTSQKASNSGNQTPAGDENPAAAAAVGGVRRGRNGISAEQLGGIYHVRARDEFPRNGRRRRNRGSNLAVQSTFLTFFPGGPLLSQLRPIPDVGYGISYHLTRSILVVGLPTRNMVVNW